MQEKNVLTFQKKHFSLQLTLVILDKTKSLVLSSITNVNFSEQNETVNERYIHQADILRSETKVKICDMRSENIRLIKCLRFQI